MLAPPAAGTGQVFVVPLFSAPELTERRTLAHVLPLRDINPTTRTPVVNYAIIAANIAVFVYQFFVLPLPEAQRFALQHAVVPAHLFSGYGPALSTALTYMFMHGGLMHLVGNLWFLYIFGDNVEDTLGHGRYLLFYLGCGVAAVAGYAGLDPDSTVPLVGASGAVSGVLGAYVLMYPKARVVTFVPIFFLFEVPAALFIVVWFGMQVLGGFDSLAQATPQQGGGVAFFAHVAGFLAGVAIMLFTGMHRSRRHVVTLGPRYRRR